MKICAVICEYNPFHTGHLYQLSEAKKSFDEIICIMSGNFVQRAEPAIAEKNVRARIALNCGASMVLELPLLYAIANGERFAEGAVKTLSRLENIDALVMGCEAENTKALMALAEIQS
ncbi:MAG: nucleotidyltransferase family protein, partial [Christensenellales bacterium]